MRTDELVAALARSAAPVDRASLARRFDALFVVGAALSLGCMLLVLGLRADLGTAMAVPMFWAKLAVPALVAIAAYACLRRLGHPGLRLGAAPLAVAAPVLALWCLAAAVLASAPAAQRPGLLLGSSWWHCPLLIAGLAVPALVPALRAMRQLAPTRLRLTGFMAGLFAGGAAAFAYAWSCPEMEPPFLAVWYVLGMLLPAAAGAVAGRRLLRW